jgi:ABC-type nitrate/sulfonate/bicarbonate transport system substrate-binding protein
MRAHSSLVVAALLSLGSFGSLAGCSKEPAPPAAPAMAPAPAAPAPPPAKPPLRVAFSDWPGWTAFEIGIQKGWFKEAGVDVKFDWFEYAP